MHLFAPSQELSRSLHFDRQLYTDMTSLYKQVRGTDRCVSADLEVLEIKIVKSFIMLIRRN